MARKGYVGIEGDVAKQIKNLYIGIDDKARKVVKIYLGVGDIAQLIFDELQCLNHNFTNIIQEIAATCDTPKQVVKQCPNCKQSNTFKEGSALGHNKDVTIASAPATCTSKGLTEGRKCSRCGTITVAQKDIDIDPNNHTGSSTYGGKEKVHTKYSCCGKTISSTHTYDRDSGVKYSNATCTQKQKNYKKCVCGYNPKSSSYLIDFGNVAPDNHTGKRQVLTSGGTENKHSIWSCCNAIYDNAHSYTESIKKATCIATGTKTYSCGCGYSYQTVIPVNPNAHTSFPWCSRCKKVYEEECEWGGFYNSSNQSLLAWHEFNPNVSQALGVDGWKNNSSHITYKLLYDWSIYGEAAPISSIDSLFIKPGITTIESYAFRNIHTVPNLALKKIYIPNTVTSLKAYAFLDCGKYEIHYQGNSADWSKVSKASGWNSSGAKIYDYAGTLLS